MAHKILLVEDNAEDVLLTQQALQNSGFSFDLKVINNGKEAVDYILQQGPYEALKSKDRPDIVLLDLNIPLMNGFEVLQTLKDHDQSKVIPIIVFTVSGDETDILRSYELGASSCIRKRVHINEFNETLRDAMAYWFKFIKLPPRV